MEIPDTIGMVGAPLVQGLASEIFAERNQRRAKEMANYNQGLALDMWNKTNYEAQRKHMERAGLNVGLLYKGAGQGGTTQGAGSAQAATAETPNAGMGIQLALQQQQVNAQTKLADAQATLALAEAHSLGGGEGTAGAADIEKKTAETENIKTDTAIKKLDEKIKDNERYLQTITMDEAIEVIRQQANQAIAEAKKAGAEAKEAEETIITRIEQIKQRAVEQQLNIALQRQNLLKLKEETQAVKEGVKKISAEILTMSTERLQSWDKLNLLERETIVKELMAKAQIDQTAFNTSTPAQIKQWTDIITQIIQSLPASGGKNPVGFKY